MNYADLRELAVHRGHIAVSIMVHSTETSGSIVAIDAACSRAVREVSRRFPDEEGMELVHILTSLRSRVAIDATVKNSVLFVNEKIAWVYPLPYKVDNLVLVSHAFETMLISQHLSRAFRYWVLLFFHGKAFLFDGYEDTIFEVMHRHTRETGEDRISLEDLSGRICGSARDLWGPHCRYVTLSEFMQDVDKALQHFFEVDPLPIVCCGDKESILAFQKTSMYASEVLTTVVVEHPINQEQLQQLMSPVLRISYDILLQLRLQELRSACIAGLSLSGVVAIWRALHQNLISALYITHGLVKCVCVLPHAHTCLESQSCIDGTIEDGVGMILEFAAYHGIRVFWYPLGALEEFDNIVAVLRPG